MITLWFAAALAAPPDLDRYPRVAEVALPETGVARLHVPPALRSADDPADGSDLLLVDAAGEPVPFAIVRGEAWVGNVEVAVVPTREPGVYELRLAEPADAIDVELLDPVAATAHVEVQEGGRWVGYGFPVTVWRNGAQHEGRIPIPKGVTTLRLGLVATDGLDNAPKVVGLREGRRLAPDVVSASVSRWGVDERGDAAYAVDLGEVLPVRRVRPHVAEDVFERNTHLRDTFGGEAFAWDVLRRVAVGGREVDDVTMPVGVPLDRFALVVDSQGKPPLTIDRIDVELEGVQLLVRDAGPGPHRLYAGAPSGTRASWDLQAAIDDLLAVAPPTPVEPGAAAPNPAYDPPELRGQLGLASVPLALERYRTQHAVPAAAGLARIPLSAEALAGARPDLADVRLITAVTADNRQLPFVMRRSSVENSWGTLPFTREELGSLSILRVALPVADVPVSAITLRTDAPLFSRRVTVDRVRGADRETLRAFDWIGEDRPGSVTLLVDERVGTELILTVDNGSDPPLPISGVEVWWPAWELVAVLPDAPTVFVTGDSRASPPDYDFALLAPDVLRRARTAVELGAAEPIPPLPMSAWDRIVLFLGLAFTVAGMIALAVRVAMARPSEPEPAPTA